MSLDKTNGLLSELTAITTTTLRELEASQHTVKSDLRLLEQQVRGIEKEQRDIESRNKENVLRIEAALREAVSTIREDIKNQKGQDASLEDRIKSLEAAHYKLIGGAIVLSFIGSAAGTALLKVLLP